LLTPLGSDPSVGSSATSKMHHTAKTWVPLLLIVSVAWYAVGTVSLVRPKILVAPRLVVSDPTAFDFGSSWHNQTVIHKLPVHNPTNSVLSVQTFRTSCGCTKIRPEQLSLAPGESAVLELSIEAIVKDDSLQDEAIQKIDLAGLSDAGGLIFQARLTGTVRRLFRVLGGAVSHSLPHIRGRTSVIEPIRITSLTKIDAIRVLPMPDLSLASVEAIENGFQINLTALPGEGEIDRKTVLIECLGAGGTPIGIQGIKLAIPVLEPVVVLPSHHNFGVVPVGEAIVSFSLNSTYDTPGSTVRVSRLEFDPEVVTVTEKRNLRFEVKLKVRKGPNSATIRFVLSEIGGEQFVVNAAVLAMGK
jgi:hypothetical protein